MKNVITIKQAVLCANELTDAAESMNRIVASKQEELEAIHQIPEKTDADLRKAAMLEDDICQYMEKETAYRFMAEFLCEQELSIAIRPILA